MGAWDRANTNQPQPNSPLEPASWGWRSPRSATRRRQAEQDRRARQGARDDVAGIVPDERAGAPRRTTRPVPKMPKPRQDTRVRSPAITLAGTLLIVGLTVLAFAGGRLFGQVAEPTPIVPTELVVPTPMGSAPEPALAPVDVAVVQQTPIPLPAAFERAPVVCLDPGHGGPDRGFLRFFDNGVAEMEEAPLVLAHALDLEARLKRRGYEVVMTRRTDAAVNIEGLDVNGDGRTAAHDAPRSDRNQTLDEMQARINICNEANADLLVSMHVNGYSNGNPRGYETWFTRERPFGDKNAAFATLAYQHLKEQFGYIGYVLPAEEERGVLPDSTADVQKEQPVFEHFIITGPAIPGIIEPSKMPGAIVESLFVSNDGDAAVLSSDEGHGAIVTAYENAIVEYFEWYPPKLSQPSPMSEVDDD